MFNQNKEWDSVNKKNKKRQHKNKSYSNNKKDNSKNLNITSKDDFPSLTSENFLINNSVFKVKNIYNNLVWRKNSECYVKETIYDKAKNGSILFNSYPYLSDTPSFPLFQ